MILIKRDDDRRIEIPGVPVLVARPVDIDQSMTGFKSLRTLRIYRFDKESIIEGHAEEDEVFIVVLAGSIELTMIVDPIEEPDPIALSGPGGPASVACAAYLPPHAAYKLVATCDADVAYARATPMSSRLPKIFGSSGNANVFGMHLVLEEMSYAERLRIRLVQFSASQNEFAFSPMQNDDPMCEGLVHVRTASPSEDFASIAGSDFASVALSPWDTVAAMPGEDLVLNIAQGSSGLALIVMAI